MIKYYLFDIVVMQLQYFQEHIFCPLFPRARWRKKIESYESICIGTFMSGPVIHCPLRLLVGSLDATA